MLLTLIIVASRPKCSEVKNKRYQLAKCLTIQFLTNLSAEKLSYDEYTQSPAITQCTTSIRGIKPTPELPCGSGGTGRYPGCGSTAYPRSRERAGYKIVRTPSTSSGPH